MTLKLRKLSILIIAAVMLVAMAFAGAASATIQDTDVARIGDSGYSTVNAAFTAATSGQTIVLLKDSTMTDEIYLSKSVTLDLNGSILTAKSGKRLFILNCNDITFTLEDSSAGKTGKLTGGTSSKGGCIYIDLLGTFVMNGGNITNCKATGTDTSDGGGCVYVYQGTFIMNSGNITGCSATKNGGGVFIYRGMSYIYGGNITGCSTTGNGGGVYIETGGITMTNGNISDCVATLGSGVYIYDKYCSFVMNNTALVNANNDVFLNNRSSGSAKIKLGTNGFASSGNYGAMNITLKEPVSDWLTKTIVEGTDSKAASTDNFVLNSTFHSLYVLAKSGNNLILSKPTYVEVDTWEGLNKSIAEWTDTVNARTVAVNASIEDRTQPGGLGDSGRINVRGKIILTTNASPANNEAVIDGKGFGSLFQIKYGGDLTLIGNGTSAILNLTGGNASVSISFNDGGAIYAREGNLTINDGVKITNCSAVDGGAVFVCIGYAFTMNGGSITDCTANVDGGGVKSCGIFTMNGGNITDCTANNDGGGVDLHSSGTFIMTGGSITYCNAAKFGGGVYSAGNFTMTGGNITKCTAEYVEPTGTLVNAGGIYVIPSVEPHMLNVSGSATVIDNKVNGTSANVGVTYSNNLTLVGPFTGSIGITTSDEAVAGAQFGTATAGASGAENFVSDYNANIIGSISDGKLVWTTAGPTPIDYGVTITNATGSYKLTNQSDTVYGNSGYAQATKEDDVVVLTLHNFNVNKPDCEIINSTAPDLTIVLDGTSNLIGNYSKDIDNSLVACNGNLTIIAKNDNSDRLLVNNTVKGSYDHGIYAIYVDKNLAIKDSANITVIANSNGAEYPSGLYVIGNISITGEDTVVDANAFCNIDDDSPYAEAICAEGDILIASGATVIANATSTVDMSGSVAEAIKTESGNIRIESGATVTAIANTKDGDASAISSECLVIDESTVTAKASGNEDYINALEAQTITISGENTVINATASSDDDAEAYAFLGKTNITITSAKKITAIGQSAFGNATSFAYFENGSYNFAALENGYTFSNATNPEAAPTSYAVFNNSNNWHMISLDDAKNRTVSNYKAVTIEKGSTPTPTPSYSSSSKHSGYTQILSQGQVAPTPYATTTPTVAPTAKPTQASATPTVKPTTQATTQPTQSSPAPVAGLIAGLGAAALVLARLRK